MLFSAFAGITIIIALVAVYLAVKILAKSTWILGFLRGFSGLLMISISVLMVLVGLDLFSYKQLQKDKPILTISFEKKDDQHFESTLLYIEQGNEQKHELYGDQWQIDARMIRWRGLFELFGAKPGYRLDRLNGRYYSLEDERRKPRSAHQLQESEFGLDFWSWAQENGRFMPLVDAIYGSATYLPMEHGAIYQISLSASGLTAKPLNPIAESAISRWQ